MTKEELLSTGHFIDNSYLDDYIILVNSIATTTYTERHHILPRAYYDLLGLDIDNSDSNLVRLSFTDHCKAHWLLYFCTTDKLQYASQTAFVIMVNGLTKRLKDYTEEDFIAIQNMKNQLLADSDTFWSTEEDEFLKNNFLKFSDEELANKLNRTEIAIRARRYYLHLPRLKMSDYTNEELDYIIANYYQKEIKEIAADLNRPVGSVAVKCSRLGLKKWQADPWTGDELEFLRKNSATMTRAEIAHVLGRSTVAVGRQCRIYGIKCLTRCADPWTAEELEYLKENYTVKTYDQIAEELSRPRSTVAYKCQVLKRAERN